MNTAEAYSASVYERYMAKSNHKKNVAYAPPEQEASFLTNLSRTPEAAWEGLQRGVMLDTPDRFYRATRTIAEIFGSEGLRQWATEGINEITKERLTNPKWQPDDAFMQSGMNKAVYEGMSSMVSSLAYALPGMLVGLKTGGVGLLPFILGGLGSGGAGGLASYDQFVDEAYAQFSEENPYITREQARDAVWNQAVVAGLAEGGFDFAGTVVAGKLGGLASKAIGRASGGMAGKALINKTGSDAIFRTKTAQLLKNTFINSPATNVPTEMAIAGTQDWMKELAGMDSVGAFNAAKEVIAPTLVSSFGFGLVNTGMTMAQRATSPAAVQAELDQIAAQGLDALNLHRQQKRDSLASDSAMEGLMAAMKELEGIEGNASAASAPSTVANSMGDSTVAMLFQEIDPASKQTLGGLFGDNVELLGQAFRDYIKNNGKLTDETRAAFESVGDVGEIRTAFREMKHKLIDRLDSAADVGLIDGSPDASPLGFLHKSLQSDLLPTKSPLPSEGQVVETIANAERLASGKLDPTMFADSLTEAARESSGIQSVRQMDMVISKAMVENVGVERLNKLAHTDKAVAQRAAKITDSGVDVLGLLMGVENATQHGDAIKVAALRMKDMHSVTYQDTRIQAEAAAAAGDMDAAATLSAAADTHLRQYLSFEFAMKDYGKNIARTLRQHQHQTPNRSRESLLKQMDMWADTMMKDGIGELTYKALMETVNQQMKAQKGLVTKDTLKQIKAALKGQKVSGDTKALQDFTRYAFESGEMNQAMDNIFSVNRAALAVDAATETGVMGILSGISTHVVNFVGNAGLIPSAICERTMGSLMIEGGGVSRGEARAMVGGLVGGFVGAIRSAVTTFRTNIPQLESSIGQDFGGSDHHNSHRAVSKNALGKFLSGKNLTAEQMAAGGNMGAYAQFLYDQLGGAVDVAGGVIGIPGRMLITSDDFFKNIAASQEMAAMEVRITEMAEAAGMDAQAYMAQPEVKQSLIDQAMKFAKEQTFQEDLTGVAKALQDARDQAPLSRLVVPFFKTPINIAKWAGTRTPFIANLWSEHRNAMNSGDPAQVAMAEAKLLTGTALGYTVMALAAQGLITGSGPRDREERDLLYATGWQPNSLRIGDTYYQFTRLDPLATFLQLAANVTDVADSVDDKTLMEIMGGFIGAGTKMATDKYFLQNVGKFIEFMNDPERNAERFGGDIGAMLMPFSGAQRMGRVAMDPFLREADGWMEGILNSTLGSSSLAKKRTLLGEAVQYGHGGTLGGVVTPARWSTRPNDPVYEELNRLRAGSEGTRHVKLARIPSEINGQPVDARTKSELLRVRGESEIGGKRLKERLQEFMESPFYSLMSDERKGLRIDAIIRQHDTMARRSLAVTQMHHLYGLRKARSGM